MSSEPQEQERTQARPGGSTRWIRGLIVYGIVFVAGAAVMFYFGRHLWNFYQLQSGSQDRSLMAISAAHLDGETLTVRFIRSAPDKPSGAFILRGHKPGHSNVSDPAKQNTVGDETVTFDDMEYEILFEATDRAAFPERSALIPFEIEWIDRETGRLTLAPVNQRAVNHITSFRAFLLLTKDDGQFYTANITFER